MRYLEEMNAYAQDILSGKIISADPVKNAVKRYQEDLEKSKEKDWPYKFDVEKGNRICIFAEALKHYKGPLAGQFIKLEPWQIFILMNLFGWVEKSTGFRRFREAYIEVPRKNGKTTFGAAVGVYMFRFDGEGGAECYTAATKKDQAKIAHKDAKQFVLKNPTLKKAIKVYKDNLVVEELGSKYEPLSADADTLDGLGPHFVLLDEYHAHPTNELFEVLETGMGARTQPLMLVITTAGFNKQSPCYRERERIEQILKGNFQDERTFGIIYCLEEGDDFTKEESWKKANPNYGVSVRKDFLEDQVTKALQSNSKVNGVLTKNFNIWTQAQTRWIKDQDWSACRQTLKIDDYHGRRAFLGIDLSSTTDITAAVLAFPPDEDEDRGRFALFPMFFLPEDDLLERERRDKVPYTQWTNSGLIKLTPGNVVDYDFIEHYIQELADEFYLQEVIFDPWGATEIINHLQDDGIECFAFNQGMRSMAPPSKEFETKILQRKISHDGNPVLSWMVSSAEIKTDPNGNFKPLKPDRKKSSARIDGVIASIMAFYRAMVCEDDGSNLTGLVSL